MSTANSLDLYYQGLNGLDLTDEKRSNRMDPTSRPRLQSGQPVILNVPDNLKLHNASGKVIVLTDYGAIIATPAAATGQFRALYSEIQPVGTGDANSKFANAVAKGYTGDICEKCGSLSMIRSGPCLKCMNCGESGGCG